MDSGFPGIKAGSAADRELDYNFAVQREERTNDKYKKEKEKADKAVECIENLIKDLSNYGEITNYTKGLLRSFNAKYSVWK